MVGKKNFDVIIVGAGPAGLLTAYEIDKNADSQLKILLVDEGQDHESRYCTVLNRAPCIGCDPCHMTHGLGGAGLFLNAKLSFYPAGSGLGKLCGGEKNALELYDYAGEVLGELGGFKPNFFASMEKIDEMRNKAEKLGIDFKYYPVKVLSSSKVSSTVQNLKRECKGTIFLFSTKALSIVPEEKNQWTVVLQNQTARYKVTSRFIVLGPGKAGTRWLHQQAEKLHLKRERNPIELGVRLEMPRSVLKSATEVHPDLKLLFNTDMGHVRTFCVCDSGIVVICKYAHEVLLGGKCANTHSTNFALLVRKRLPLSIDPIQYGFSFARRINKATRNGILAQRLGDFKLERPSPSHSISKNKAICTVDPSQLTAGNVRDFYSEDVIEGIESALSRMNKFSPGIYDDSNLLYAPEIELCWDKFNLDSNMRTNLEGLYIVGDVCGHARGIMQAAITGILAGRGILEDIF